MIQKLIKRYLIYHYGLLEWIMTDNATNFNNKMMIEMCEQFKVKHHNSVTYRPKMNGVVEISNKNLKKIIQKMMITYKY